MDYRWLRTVILLVTFLWTSCFTDTANLSESSGLNSDKSSILSSTEPSHSVSQSSSTLHPQSNSERRCRGTSSGISHAEQEEDVYNLYKNKYTNCTYVEGNLELVFLQNHDLSFLKDIREVTGYVLIVANYADYIPLISLMIIRGRTLFEFEKKYYSLYVALNYDTGQPDTVGLKELRMPNLHEILAGNVFFQDNKLLCFEDKVNWTDIMSGEGAQTVFNNVRNCGTCHESCQVYSGKRHCWGAEAQYCQNLTKLSCSPQCDGRCFGYDPNQCCHQECAAGCTGNSKDQCLACKNFYNDGSCENYCPPEMIYDPKLYKNVPNPNVKYAYGALCLDKCPAHSIADRGACVQDCGAGKIAREGRCVDCDGPCPKTCKIVIDDDDFIHSGNIHQFAGCTIIQGSIRIFTASLEGDPFRNISAMSVEDLSVLENIQEVSNFVQIQVDHPHFRNLLFLRNLKVIHGRKRASGASLQVFQTSLHSLSLNSLQEVKYGAIFISNNSALCYSDTITWRNITENSDPKFQKITVEFNRNRIACERDNEKCSAECSSEGCWGSQDYQCRSCRNFHLGRQCLSSCDSVRGVYQSGPQECRHCHPECRNSCTGENPDQCDDCRNARDGPYCVSACPKSKYLDENSVCQMCNPNCQDGCTGPRSTVGEGGCNSCGLVELVDEESSSVNSCLPPESNCTDGFYKKMLAITHEVRGLAGKHACVKCHPECRTCYGSGISFCLTCKHYEEEKKCVSRCSSNYYLDPDTLTCLKCDARCLICNGPSASHCLECKEFKLYLDYENRQTNQSFVCTDHCPDHVPDAVQEKIEGTLNSAEMICAKEGRAVKMRTAYLSAIIGGFLLLCLILIISLIFLWRCRRSKNIKKRLRNTMSEAPPSQHIHIYPTEAKPDMSNLPLITREEVIKEGIIGSGAFGTVYKGKLIDVSGKGKDIDVAIKVLREAAPSTQASRESLECLEEARIMASVNHPCCTKIIAVCLTKEIMLITKLMHRGCLLDYIRGSYRGIGSETLLLWCKQIAEGMDYLESKQIIHRDLAARNVLVESRHQVKITDFGLARLLQDEEEQLKFTGGKMPIKWLALECLTSRTFSHKTDVWSYGVTIWELLTFGERPYEEYKTAEIPGLLDKGMRLSKPKCCHDYLYNKMRQCWEKDPIARPTFSMLANEFEDMLKNPEHYIHRQRQDLRTSSISKDENSRPLSSRSRRDSNREGHVMTGNSARPYRNSARSNHSRNMDRDASEGESLVDDVFEMENGTLTRISARNQEATSQANPNHYIVMSKNRSGANLNVDNKTERTALLPNTNCSNDAAYTAASPLNRVDPVTGTPVWTRRHQAQRLNDPTSGEYLDDGYLEPSVADPVQHVDLLNGHYRPSQELQSLSNGAANGVFSFKSHPAESTELPLLSDRKLSHSSRMTPVQHLPPLPLRIRKGSHDYTDTDLSCSTLDTSEPDYYNDLCEPAIDDPLLISQLESPV